MCTMILGHIVNPNLVTRHLGDMPLYLAIIFIGMLIIALIVDIFDFSQKHV